MAARSTAIDTGTSARLAPYWAKRDFTKTAEPRGTQRARGKELSFVIQKHAARRLHYDFRLELDGVLVSWAVPKGPSYDPADKRLAVHVEDHPLSYGSFEGTIAPKQYGAGTVIVWDQGSWDPLGDPHLGLRKGKLAFNLHGQKLKGQWELVRMRGNAEAKEPWLLFKKRDEFARPRSQYDVVSALPDSVIARPLKAKSAPPQPKPTKPTKGKSPAGSLATAPGAVRADLPAALSPQLATLVDTPPSGEGWIYEIKFDGYRIMARIDKGKVRLLTRGGHDWSEKMPHLVSELQQLPIRSAWLDGEIVVLGKDGVPDFNALQKAFDSGAQSPLKYFLFDLPFLDGYDLRDVQLATRRQLLQALLASKHTPHVRYSADFPADAASVLHTACAMHLEGVIAKRADAPYTSTRSRNWLKLKCKLRQEFVVCGYVQRSDDAAQIGSLLLGVHADGQLRSVGRVGTGWDADDARMLRNKLGKLAVTAAPFTTAAKAARRSRSSTGRPIWVKPALVAEVEFSEWTPDGQIRHASFLGLRSDKPAASVVRETAINLGQPVPTKAKRARTGAVKITHGDRIIDPSTKLTKQDLVHYYESVSEWMLPHLQGRPCSLLRGPSGVAGQLFFQKHAGIGIAGVRQLDASLWPGHQGLLEIDSAAALASAAQMNVIEFHTWNSTTRKINSPDRMVFDLDPGAGTSWGQMQEGATLLHSLLEQLGLSAWLKTSGGKGLHVVVPVAPRWDYGTVKDFSRAIVQHLAKTIPSRFVLKSGPANRVGKIFVDYLRNGFGATTAAAFSARARPGLGVSMPVAWQELASIKSGAQWTVRNAREHLSQVKRDPWAQYWQQSQSLTDAMKILSFKPRGK